MMKPVYRTYKFRMYPGAGQRQVLARYFGSVRFIYNHYLAERKRQYEETGRSDGYAKQAKDLVDLKRTEGFDWLKEINSQTLQQTLMHLDTAYRNFFNHTADFPKFKSRKRGGSVAVPQFNCIENGYGFPGILKASASGNATCAETQGSPEKLYELVVRGERASSTRSV